MRTNLEALAEAALVLARAAGGGTEVALLAPGGDETKAWIACRWRTSTVERHLDEIRGAHLSLLAWEGGVAWDDNAIALAHGSNGLAFDRLLRQIPKTLTEGGPGLDDLPEGLTTLPSPWEATSAHARLLWESLLPSQDRRPHALLDGGARLLRCGPLVALCSLSLTTSLGLQRIP